MNRRNAIKLTAASAIATSLAPLTAAEAAPAFALPELPFALDALEPHIDARTMEIHHGKHHAAYVKNLNTAIATEASAAGKSLVDLVKTWDKLPESIATTVRNNGGGHYNHDLFWKMIAPKAGGEPKAELKAAIEKSFGTFAAFQESFTKAAMGQFGSGWAWLTLDGKELKVEGTPNQDNPITAGRIPLLGLDVWEHAYYLHYQNRRADYVTAFWNVVNWDFVTETYKSSLG